MAAFQDDYHADVPQDIQQERQAGHSRAVGKLLVLVDDVLQHGMSPGELPVGVAPNGKALYERCAPQMFGIFCIEPPPAAGALPVLKVLSVAAVNAVALANAMARA